VNKILCLEYQKGCSKRSSDAWTATTGCVSVPPLYSSPFPHSWGDGERHAKQVGSRDRQKRLASSATSSTMHRTNEPPTFPPPDFGRLYHLGRQTSRVSHDGAHFLSPWPCRQAARPAAILSTRTFGRMSSILELRPGPKSCPGLPGKLGSLPQVGVLMLPS
jgi:hypothetical protein